VAGKHAIDDRCEDYVHRHVGIHVIAKVAPGHPALADCLHRGTAVRQESVAEGVGYKGERLCDKPGTSRIVGCVPASMTS